MNFVSDVDLVKKRVPLPRMLMRVDPLEPRNVQVHTAVQDRTDTLDHQARAVESSVTKFGMRKPSYSIFEL